MLRWGQTHTPYLSTSSVYIGIATAIAAPAAIINRHNISYRFPQPLALAATAVKETTKRTDYKIASTLFILLDDCFSIHFTPSFLKLIILR
jgi:hypothetical protein